MNKNINKTLKGKRIDIKSKYILYVLLFFVAHIGQVRVMEIEISESDKQLWHTECVYWVLEYFLEKNPSPLCFEIIGSKKFIAEELRKKLDTQDYDFKVLIERRNFIFEELKRHAVLHHSSLICESIDSLCMFIKPGLLLPFILSLEEPIKKRIVAANRTVEIEWRKKAYKPYNFNTHWCKNIKVCFELDIEKDFTLEELQDKRVYNSVY